MNLCKKILQALFEFLLFLISPQLSSYHSWHQKGLSEKLVPLKMGQGLLYKAEYFTLVLLKFYSGEQSF